MTMNPELLLHEEVMLLALSEDKGTIESGTWFPQAVGGAVLSEFLLSGHVRVAQEGKKSLIRVQRTEPFGNELVDEWLVKMRKSDKLRRVGDWLARISSSKDLKGRVASGLAKRGILEVEHSKVLFIFNRTRYPEADAGPETEIRERLHEAIFTETKQVDARTIALLSIANAAGLLNVVFSRGKLKPRKARIDKLIEGELTGPAAAALIRGVQAAITAACIVPIIVST